MTELAFAYITSKAVVARTVASIRSLEDVGALPGAVAYVLCLDDEAHRIISDTTAAEFVRPLSVADIPEVMAFSDRPISRFAVACKPYLLRWILTVGGAEKSLYFDSDIWFASNPSFLFDELDSHDILLVPYMIDPDTTIEDWANIAKNAQRTGYYNAGFVGASAHASKFLDWWANRCAYSTFRDFYEDISGDQKYLNWVPSLFPNVGIQRNYGLNIKPWNTQYFQFERREDGVPTLNGDIVVYFHFSQDLGNLLNWPEDFYPEVSRYLEELEQARSDSGVPYVDMPRRDNTDLTRPLLPREGKQAQLFSLVRNYRKPLHMARRTMRAAVARGVQSLSPAVKERLLRQYLNDWPLAGDARLETFEALYGDLLPLQPGASAVFAGVSRFAYFLAYHDHPADIFDPFQGHFNHELKQLFNVQWREAEAMRDVLGVGNSLRLHRLPVVEAVQVEGPVLLVVSSRREPDELVNLVTDVAAQPTLKYVVTVFDAAWPLAYRQHTQSVIEQALAGRPVSIEGIKEVDLYRVGQPRLETDQESHD